MGRIFQPLDSYRYPTLKDIEGTFGTFLLCGFLFLYEWVYFVRSYQRKSVITLVIL